MSEERAVYQTEAGAGPAITPAQELEMQAGVNKGVAEELRGLAVKANNITWRPDACDVADRLVQLADILEGKPGAALEEIK